MSSENRHRDATSGNNEGSGNSGDSRFGTQQGHIECPSNDEAPTVAREVDQPQATTIVKTNIQLHDRAFSDILYGETDNTTEVHEPSSQGLDSQRLVHRHWAALPYTVWSVFVRVSEYIGERSCTLHNLGS